MDKTPREMYQEREKRVSDTIALKIPDRVPVMLEMSYFPARYAGITCEAVYYDYDRWLEANRKAVRDFAPDIVQLTQFFPGKVYEILDPKQIKWPGHGADPYHTHRFIEGEFLKADEYDALMADHTDFLLRYYVPRIFGALEPFSRLPPFWTTTMSYMEVPELAEALVSPEIHGALEKLLAAGQEMARWSAKRKAFGEAIEAMGFPLHGVRGAHVPFDFLSYHMRGLQGMYLDMYRQPEKLIEVFDNLLPVQLKKAVISAQKTGKKRVFWALHRGADGFMSNKQFEKFYWPYVKRIVHTLLDEGLVPCLFLEGDYTSRLEYFLELPRGKVMGRFDCSDIRKAKEVLGGHMCIMGNVPSSILAMGTPREVEDYCRMLIDVVGKGGGLIVAPRSAIDEARPENVRRMVDFTKEYGRYG
jgi:uroporphyrinogen-III decarboxylase